MSNINLLFIPIYLIGFIVFSHLYISVLHDIRKGISLLATKIIDEDYLNTKIETCKKKMKVNKRKSFIFFSSVFGLNLLFTLLSRFYDESDLFWSLGIFGLFFLFQLMIYWMKGAGTIDSNARFPGGYRL